MIRYLKYKQYPISGYGGLETQVTKKLIKICKKYKTIVIYGYTKSGKVIIAKELAKQLNCKLIISDNYKRLGFYKGMYYIRDVIKDNDEQIIIEGVQSGRILRKGVQNNDFFADLVIELEINYKSIIECYYKTNESYKLKYNRVYNFNFRLLDKIYNEWKKLQDFKTPEINTDILKINTSFA